MKKRSQKIDKIVTLARSEERRSGQAAGQFRRELEEQVERLGELNAYRHSYAQLAQSMQHIDSAHWKDYQEFLARLDEAVQSQRQVVKHCQQHLDLYQRRWMIKRQRLESLERVLERHRRRESTLEERRAQRRIDDRTAPPDIYAKDIED